MGGEVFYLVFVELSLSTALCTYGYLPTHYYHKGVGKSRGGAGFCLRVWF